MLACTPGRRGRSTAAPRLVAHSKATQAHSHATPGLCGWGVGCWVHLARMRTNSPPLQRQCVRAVKEMDSKSIGLCPQGFESPRCRFVRPLACFQRKALWTRADWAAANPCLSCATHLAAGTGLVALPLSTSTLGRICPTPPSKLLLHALIRTCRLSGCVPSAVRRSGARRTGPLGPCPCRACCAVRGTERPSKGLQQRSSTCPEPRQRGTKQEACAGSPPALPLTLARGVGHARNHFYLGGAGI